MTGDGLRFAIHGAELAAAAARRALEHGWPGVHQRLAAERRRAFAGKWRFNRARPHARVVTARVDAAAMSARFAPAVFHAIIALRATARSPANLDPACPQG
jgi:flavin-dependent dehydrogenase